MLADFGRFRCAPSKMAARTNKEMGNFSCFQITVTKRLLEVIRMLWSLVTSGIRTRF